MYKDRAPALLGAQDALFCEVEQIQVVSLLMPFFKSNLFEFDLTI